MATKAKSAASRNSEEVEHVPLSRAVTTLLEEARTLLPGLQALFGFQLIAVFNEPFAWLDSFHKTMHWVAILLTLFAMALLMTPAALDRLTGTQHVTKSFVRTSSRLICIAMIPLMMALSLETYVISSQIFKHSLIALASALGALILFSLLWFALPLYARSKGH